MSLVIRMARLRRGGIVLVSSVMGGGAKGLRSLLRVSGTEILTFRDWYSEE